MAIDTRDERASVIGYGIPWLTPLPLADSDVDEKDRAQLLGLFPGFDYGSVVGTSAGLVNAITGDATGTVINPVTGTSAGLVNAITGEGVGVVPAVVVRGGGVGKRKKRRIVIDGQVYTARDRAEEQMLLARYIEQQTQTLEAAEPAHEPGIRARIRRAEKRIGKSVKVETEEASAHLDRLRREDEELFLLMVH